MRTLALVLAAALVVGRDAAGRAGGRTALERGSRFGIRLRLLRRVIEIRDAELALRPYWRGEVAAWASAAARSAALSESLELAVVDAAVVIDAAGARMRGMPPACEPVAEYISAGAGDDLFAEVRRLIQVSRGISRSPVVRGEDGTGAPAIGPRLARTRPPGSAAGR